MKKVFERLEHWKLNTKLLLGFGFLTALIAVVGFQSVLVANDLTTEAQRVFEQDLLGISHALEAQVGLVKTGRGIRQVLLTENAAERAQILKTLAKVQESVAQDLVELEPRILRPEVLEKFSHFKTAYSYYKPLTDSILKLLAEGSAPGDAEVSRILNTPDYVLNRDLAEAVLEEVVSLKSTSVRRDNAAARAESGLLTLGTLVLVFLGLAAGLGLGLVIARSIRRPLSGLQASIDNLTSGQLDTPVSFVTLNNEIGDLAKSIEVLQARARVQERQRWIKQELVDLDLVVQNAQSFEDFAEALTARVAPTLGLVYGAFYIADAEQSHLHRAGGYASDNLHSAGFAWGQGLVGQAAFDRRQIHLQLPGQSTVGVSVGLGLVVVENILVSPVVHQDRVLGVWEMGAIEPFDPQKLEFLNELLPVIGAKLQILSGNVTTRELLEKSQAQTLALAASEHQLQARRADLEASQAVMAAAEERTRMILGSVNEGIWGFSASGETTFVNPAALKMLGYEEAEVFGHSMHELVHHHRADGSVYPLEECPMYLSRVKGEFRRVDDEVLWRKDGTSFPVEYEANPIVKDGAVVGTVIVFRDITERKLMDQKMASERAKLQQILDKSPIAVASLMAGKIEFANPKLKGLFNIEVGGGLPDIWAHPEQRTELYAILGREGYVSDFPAQLKHKNGELIEGLVTMLPLEQDGQKGVLGWIQDVTEQRRAALAIAEERERLQTILDQSPVGVAFSTGGILRFGNPEFMNTFGATIGEPTPNFYVRNEDREAIIQAVQTKGVARNHELQMRAKDGRILDMLVTYMPITYGGEKGILGWIQDTTERKRASDLVRISQERLDSALKGANLGLWDWQADPDVLITNEIWATMLGYTEAEMDALFPPTAARWAGMVYPEDLDRAVDNFTKFITGQISEYRIEMRMNTKSGQPKWILAVGDAASRDESGRVTRMVGIHQDITAMKQNEVEMEQALAIAEDATKAKSDFLANMSHEIRTPMNAIIGMSHLALQTDLSAKQRNYIGKVDSAARNLLGIINDILDFSKIEAGKMTFEKAPFFLEDVMENLADLSVIKAQDKGLELLFDLGTDVPTALVGDSLRLGQVMTNLVGNAIKFTEKGEITVGVHKVSDSGDQVCLRFEVKDTGIGLTEAQRTKLFSAFSQADASTTRKYGGTGLGLTISKKLVELMEGQIGVDSVPAQGSTFYFTGNFGKQAEQRHLALHAQDVSGLRILIVDDNASAREILQSILASLKFESTAVSSGGEAIGELEQAHLEHRPYGLVLMDWMMPGMDGVETIKRIRADIQLSKIPAFVMVTAYSREELMVRAEGVQIDGVLVKPVSPSTLLDSILNALGKDVGKQARKQEKLSNYKEAADRVKGATILLVEDNPVNQELALELLQEAGLLVDVANNGAEAVEMVGKKTYDGVLMDCQMPVMDGFEATRAIRKDTRFASLPILAMTANAMAGDKERCVEAGMNDHIAKPIDVSQLFLTLASWLKAPGRTTGSSQLEMPAAPASDGVPAVPGLDLVGAMARVGGSAKLLKKLILRFEETQSLVIDRIKAAIEASDTNTAVREAHTVKGLAGNIGAAEMAQTAALVEGMLNRGETDGLATALDAMEAELKSLVARISKAFGLAPPQPPSSALAPPIIDEALASDLKKLAVLLADSDSEASDVAEGLTDRLLALKLGSPVKRMVKQLEEYDFDAALVCVKEIATSLGISL